MVLIRRLMGRLAPAIVVAALLAAGPAACSGPRATVAQGTVAPGDTVPLGMWTTTITEADLRAAGMTNPGEIVENVGTFTMTLAPDGTWTIAQVTDHPLKWPVFRGTHRVVAGNLFELVTTFPEDYAGDIAGITWRLEGDVVSFDLAYPDDEPLRINLEAHPWMRKG